jgi:hypothetical protein
MTRATLIPNVKITDEYGVTFPAAMVVILAVELNDSWNMKAGGIDEEFNEENCIGGGTYEAMYYCTPEARAQGVPLKPLRTYEDGMFSNVLIIDADAAEIKQLLTDPTAKKDKAIPIVRKDLELRFR